jgi:hypothetical protein
VQVGKKRSKVATLTDEQRKKLNGYYRSLIGQEEIIAQESGNVVPLGLAMFVFDEIARIKSDFPDLLPPFDPRLSDYNADFSLKAPIRAFVVASAARIKSLLDADGNIAPIGERIEF